MRSEYALTLVLTAALLHGGRAPDADGRPVEADVRVGQAAETLRVDRAGSLDEAIRAMGARFEAAHPGVVVLGERGGSVDLARRATAAATTPDVIALADYAIIPRLLVPVCAAWYAAFARNSMVLAYTDRSAHASEIDAGNWVDILLRPGVRSGHSDPARDPGGYRAVLVLRLAERHYRRPGLGAALERAAPVVVSPPGQTLYDRLEDGTLDYVLTYRSSALARGLRTIELPAEINLSDPARAASYAEVSLQLPREPGATDSIVIRGEPILYGVTVPNRAAHRELAEQFVRDMLSGAGQSLLREHGFLVPDDPITAGEVPPVVRGGP
jgi:molybdate/tungstate transport system substrate-binding protein